MSLKKLNSNNWAFYSIKTKYWSSGCIFPHGIQIYKPLQMLNVSSIANYDMKHVLHKWENLKTYLKIMLTRIIRK